MVDLEVVRDALGRQRFYQEAAERTAVPGVSTGLAVTGTGGDILFIEVTRMKGDGKLVLTFWSGRTGMVSVTSGDGGVTLDAPVVISQLSTRNARPFRAPPLIAAELERSGSVLTAWQDCRFRSGCTANDVVIL